MLMRHLSAARTQAWDPKNSWAPHIHACGDTALITISQLVESSPISVATIEGEKKKEILKCESEKKQTG